MKTDQQPLPVLWNDDRTSLSVNLVWRAPGEAAADRHLSQAFPPSVEVTLSEMTAWFPPERQPGDSFAISFPA